MQLTSSANQYSATGYVKNHFSIGPAILWAPFLLMSHGAVLCINRLGAHIPADGYSPPYVATMAAATALYGFMGLLLAFDLARKYFGDRWAFLATVGIWCASSIRFTCTSIRHGRMRTPPLPSLCSSGIGIAQEPKEPCRGGSLGFCAALMMDVYYPNAILLLVPAAEALADYRFALQHRSGRSFQVFRLSRAHAIFVFVTCLGVLPTLVVHHVIYGHAFSIIRLYEIGFGAPRRFCAFFFSADHGMPLWTPILIPAILGLILFVRRDRIFGTGLLLSFLAYYYFIASYPDWDGISSYGNRFLFH